jgi:hypothetical protein
LLGDPGRRGQVCRELILVVLLQVFPTFAADPLLTFPAAVMSAAGLEGYPKYFQTASITPNRVLIAYHLDLLLPVILKRQDGEGQLPFRLIAAGRTVSPVMKLSWH